MTISEESMDFIVMVSGFLGMLMIFLLQSTLIGFTIGSFIAYCSIAIICVIPCMGDDVTK